MILYAAIFRSLCKLKHNQIAFDCVPNERQFAIVVIFKNLFGQLTIEFMTIKELY